MKKIAFIIMSTLLLGTPIMAMEDADTDTVESAINSINITMNGNTVRVTGAANMQLEIFNLTGAKVGTVRIDSSDKTLNLNLPKGCYILKVNKVVRKISIR